LLIDAREAKLLYDDRMEGKQTIGIVGGGQLGRMLTEAALPLGYHVIVLDPQANCPAVQVGAEQIIGDLYDQYAIKRLAEKSDFLTIEIEHVNADALQVAADNGVPVNPTAKTIHIIEDKFKQKEFLAAAGLPVADFVAIDSLNDAQTALKHFSGKMLLKTRHGAYDGRGNRLVTSTDELSKAYADFNGRPLYAERFVSFTKELAVMTARSLDGQIAVYPVVETIQARSICLEVLAPAPVAESLQKKTIELAQGVSELFEGGGVLGIEFFLSDDGQVLVNEIAPRVHNSGHYTIEACVTSQFTQHIRAITGMSLGSTAMQVPAAVMINVLGERDGPTRVRGVEKVAQIPYTTVHLYGKSPTKIDRKMGHITAIGQNLEEAKLRAEQVRKDLDI
jgi:5-(carboxyamino)imidazole ribonucleotide synthase